MSLNEVESHEVRAFLSVFLVQALQKYSLRLLLLIFYIKKLSIMSRNEPHGRKCGFRALVLVSVTCSIWSFHRSSFFNKDISLLRGLNIGNLFLGSTVMLNAAASTASAH